MRKLTTIILGASCLILAIVIGAVEHSPQGGGRGVSQLVRFDEKEVQTMKLRRGGQEVVMKKIQGHWFFTSPEQDKINRGVMAELLDQLNHLTILDRLESKELVDDKALPNLGLTGEEALEVEIQSIDGKDVKSQVIVIGRPSPRVNSVYAFSDKEKRKGTVTIVNGDPHPLLDSPFDSLRERQLVTIPSGAMVQIGVKIGKNEVVIQRNLTGQGTPWQLVKPVAARADQSKIDDLMEAILKLQINEVISPDSDPMIIPNPVPEGAALVRFRILGTEKPVTLYLEKEANQADDFGPPLLTARLSSRPSKYTLNSMILDELPSRPGDLRDRRLENVPVSHLESIGIMPHEVFVKLERKEEGLDWRVPSAK